MTELANYKFVGTYVLDSMEYLHTYFILLLRYYDSAMLVLCCAVIIGVKAARRGMASAVAAFLSIGIFRSI